MKIKKTNLDGFYTKSEKATVVYMTTTDSPVNDCGVRWDSLDIPWPAEKPLISDKDKKLVIFEKFNSPF